MQLAPAAVQQTGCASGADAAIPVTSEAFAAAMAALGPFECKPDLAVAVSGGRDSMALALLARQWTAERSGSLTALIVDHGLRPESAEEAKQAAGILHGCGIAAEILSWKGGKPRTGISEAARSARYELLVEHCRARGILHLLLGHQQEDQAETVLLRLTDASGPEGLAGMSSVGEGRDVRLLRPLLGFRRAQLAATVLQHGLNWIDDPSNQRDDYARIRIRKSLDAVKQAALADVTSHAATVRRTIENRLASLLVRLVSIDQRGYAWLDAQEFHDLPSTLAERSLRRLAAVFGGRHYPARRAGLARAVGLLRDGRSTAAGGCLFDHRGARVLVCREVGAIGPRQPIDAGRTLLWDRRYLVTAPDEGSIGCLGPAGRTAALQAGMEALRSIPALVASALPALWQGDGLQAVFLPQGQKSAAGSGDRRADRAPATLIACPEAVFQPSQALTPPAWLLVLPPAETMYLDRQAFSLRGRS